MQLLNNNSTKKSSYQQASLQQYKFFISSLNHPLGYLLVEEFRNDHENDVNPTIITGTLYDNNTPIHPSVKQVLDKNNFMLITQTLIDSDVVIINLNIEEDLHIAEQALSIFKYYKPNDQLKLLIFISTILTWHNTPLKENSTDESVNDSILTDEADVAIKKKYSPFTDSEFSKRKSSSLFRRVQKIEKRSAQLANLNPKFKSYVIAGGLTFGCGESVLIPQFQRAWLEQDKELKIYGEGKNILPLIHIRDLVEFVTRVVSKRPNNHYFIAVDDSLTSQRTLIKTIAENIGGGKVKNIPAVDGCFDPEFWLMTQNIWVKPSRLGNLDELSEASEDDIHWKYKEGIIKHFPKIKQEFMLYRGYKQTKILLIGPPSCGKTEICNKIYQKFKIPLINAKELLDYIHKSNNEFSLKVKDQLNQIHQKMTDDAKAIFDIEKKKKRVPKGQPEPQFDPSVVESPRLPDDLLVEVFKWRLGQNDVQNLGYILDGFPKSVEQAKFLFGEEEHLNNELLPETLIALNISEEQVKEKLKHFNLENHTHHTEDGVTRRFNNYKKHIQPMTDYLNKHIQHINIEFIHEEQALEEMLTFIQRNGKLADYSNQKAQTESISFDDYVEPIPSQVAMEVPKEEVLSPTKIKENLSQVQRNKKNQNQLDKELDEKTKMELLRIQEKEVLDIRSQPIRQYLADNVIPYITEGLIQIIKQKPKDAIEFLASYLEKKSGEITHD